MKSFDIASALAIPDLPLYLQQVQQGLEASVADAETGIRKPAIRVMRAGGKRLRPALALAVASQSTSVDERSINAAIAVELVHIASLIHDDIIDGAATRWHTPTINSQEGVHQAMLVGDYLFARAGGVAAGVHAEAAVVIADTITKLCNGESRELASQHKLNRTVDDLGQVMQAKTASLFATACHLGALCGNHGSVQIEAAIDFGREFGMAFQLLDDILDFVASPELIGKPTGVDVRQGIYTLPILLALQGSSNSRLKTLLAETPESLSAILEVLVANNVLAKSTRKVEHYCRAAAAAGRRASFTSQLIAFPGAYVQWVFTNLVAPEYQAGM